MFTKMPVSQQLIELDTIFLKKAENMDFYMNIIIFHIFLIFTPKKVT